MKPKAYGARHVPGTMNRLEAAFAQRLEARKLAGEVAWYRFEAMTIRLVDRDNLTRFTPDFLVQLADGELVVYEVKGGLFPEHNRLKLKLAADQYPFRFILARRPRKAEPWTEEDI